MYVCCRDNIKHCSHSLIAAAILLSAAEGLSGLSHSVNITTKPKSYTVHWL